MTFRTVRMPCGSGPGHEKTFAPHPPGPTTTITQPCGRGHCQPGTTTLSASGTKDCTVVVVPSPTPDHPRGTLTITSVCADKCAPTTIPPPPRCKTGCTATIVQPPPVMTTRAPEPPITITTTSVCTKGPKECKPTTIRPPPSCTTGTCTVSVIETPPVTTTVTSSCTGPEEDCSPETVSPTEECTTGTCTVSVIVTPTEPLTTTAETTPPITITETETCTDGLPGCTATTIFPTPECTIGTCTVTVIETTTTTDAPTVPTETVEETTTAPPEPTTTEYESGTTITECVIPTQTFTVSAIGRDGVTSDIPVPPCATIATFRVVGGGGSGEENYGGDVKGSIPVTPGKVIQAIAGGSGVIGASGTGYGNGGATILGSRGAGAGSSLSLHGDLKAVGGGGGGGPCKNRTTSNGVYYPFDGSFDDASSSAGFPGKSGEFWRTVAPALILGKANGGKPGTQIGVGAGGNSTGAYTAMTMGKSGRRMDGGASVTVRAGSGKTDTNGSGGGNGGNEGDRPSLLQGGGTGANESGANKGGNKDDTSTLPESSGSKNNLQGTRPGKGKPDNEQDAVCASGAGGGGYYGGGSGTALLRLGTTGGSISLAAGGGGGSSYLADGVRNGVSTTNTGRISAPGMVVVVFSG